MTAIHTPKLRTIVTGAWRYTRCSDGSEQLFDLVGDPLSLADHEDPWC